MVRKSWNSDSSVPSSILLNFCTNPEDSGIFVGDFGTIHMVSLLKIQDFDSLTAAWWFFRRLWSNRDSSARILGQLGCKLLVNEAR